MSHPNPNDPVRLSMTYGNQCITGCVCGWWWCAARVRRVVTPTTRSTNGFSVYSTNSTHASKDCDSVWHEEIGCTTSDLLFSCALSTHKSNFEKSAPSRWSSTLYSVNSVHYTTISMLVFSSSKPKSSKVSLMNLGFITTIFLSSLNFVFAGPLDRRAADLQLVLRETKKNTVDWHFALLIQPPTSGKAIESLIDTKNKCMTLSIDRNVQVDERQIAIQAPLLAAEGEKTNEELKAAVIRESRYVPHASNKEVLSGDFNNCFDFTTELARRLGVKGYLSQADAERFKGYHDEHSAEVKAKTDQATIGRCSKRDGNDPTCNLSTSPNSNSLALNSSDTPGTATTSTKILSPTNITFSTKTTASAKKPKSTVKHHSVTAPLIRPKAKLQNQSEQKT
ncbi:hypothetical protein K435DRAFT_870600 [Dendrothele bispora CBS 962.96]|uniref:Uncharacterized protein n=1 Tax=Dendrothele bispora (strain CBS 962.96) TaxID=1314807 RepID=A0A4S8L670_DENBC|nr:hypothetical protein K435DRAFT_870600 [Dendrothele bispora CBS 962.96]